jgi:hypothetical protein
VLGALFVGIVSWVLGLVVKDRSDKKPAPPPPPPPRPNPYPRTTYR